MREVVDELQLLRGYVGFRRQLRGREQGCGGVWLWCCGFANTVVGDVLQASRVCRAVALGCFTTVPMSVFAPCGYGWRNEHAVHFSGGQRVSPMARSGRKQQAAVQEGEADDTGRHVDSPGFGCLFITPMQTENPE